MHTLEIIMMAMQFLLTFGNVCIMMYAFRIFLKRPQKSLEDRVTMLEFKVKDNEASLKQGNDKFRSHERAIEVIIHSLMALIEFEVQYCITEKKPMSEELKEAKDDLHGFLAKRGDNL